MAKSDPLAEAAELAERRDLGNLPSDAPQPVLEAEDDAPEVEPEPEPEEPRESPDVLQLREQMQRMEQELAVARSAYRAPEPALPSFDASNILPFEIDPAIIESLGLPASATKTVSDVLKVVALSAKNAATQEVEAKYYALQQQQARAQAMRSRFYGDNPDLEPYAAFVATTATQVKQAYPTAAEEALLPIVATTVRAQLQQLGVDPAKKRRKRRPAMSDSPGSSSGSRPAPQRDYGQRLLNKWAQ